MEASNKRNRILEGLSLKRINEGAFFFENKVDEFMRECDKYEVKFVKAALKILFETMDEMCDGYEEGPKPMVKDTATERVMTWKVQLRKEYTWEFFEALNKKWGKVGAEGKKEMLGVMMNAVSNRSDETGIKVGTPSSIRRGKLISKDLAGPVQTIYISIPKEA